MDRKDAKTLTVINLLFGVFYAVPLFLVAALVTGPDVGSNPDFGGYTLSEWSREAPKTFRFMLPFPFVAGFIAFALNWLFLFIPAHTKPHASEAAVKMALLTVVVAWCSVLLGSMLVMS